MFYDGQYGFRKHRSTTDAVTDVLGSVLDKIENKQVVFLTMIDLSKAFDVLDHSILIAKLEHYGVRGVCAKWFKSFLSDRVLAVKINDVTSSNKPVSLGSPQGGVISSTLFSIFINDVKSSLKYSDSILFADDMSIVTGGHEYHVAYSRTKHDVKNISDWFQANRLYMNTSKTTQILFSNIKIKQKPMIIDGETIFPNNHGKLLGMIIDDKLNWEAHFLNLRSKLSFGIHRIRSVKNLLDIKTKKDMYYAFFPFSFTIWTTSMGIYDDRKFFKKTTSNAKQCH